MELTAPFEIEVVDAQPREARLVKIEIRPGTTVGEAIAAAGLAPGAGGVGVFGKPRQLSDLVAPGDRIELYRPLTMDPKDRRRLLA